MAIHDASQDDTPVEKCFATLAELQYIHAQTFEH